MIKLCRFVLCCLTLAPTALGDEGTWAFPGEMGVASERLLDLRYLNEDVAGQSGFVRLSDDGNDMLLGDGAPARFWGVSCGVSGDQLPKTTRWLASLGVNLVRICSSPEASATLNPKEPSSNLTRVDRKAIDKAHRMVAELKKQGIYTMITPYWVAKGSDVTNWDIDGYTGKSGGTDGLWGLLFFNETLQAAYKNWMKELLTSENPYTGLPLASEPAVALILLQNEDSLLWWTASKMAAPQQELLGRQFAAWATERYGSLDDAFRTWEGVAVKGDAPDRGVLAFYHLHEATRNQTGGRAIRVNDQIRFFAETMRAFNEEMERYLRDDLGCRQLIIAENWKTADQPRLLDAERWAYCANDVIAKNHYFGGIHQGPRAGYRIEPGDLLLHRSVLNNPRALPASMKHVDGHPHMVTESSWVNPNLYQSEGPFLTAAYMSLTGMDGYVWFVSGPGYGDLLGTQTRETATTPMDMPGGYGAVLYRRGGPPRKWEIAQPMLAGMFPAAAIAYRQGYIRRADPVVREQRRLDNVLSRVPPTICEDSGFDPNRDEGAQETPSVGSQIDPLAFLVGPITTRYSGEDEQTCAEDLSRFIDRDARLVRSATGEIVLDYGRGVCTVDAPRAQGACGFLGTRGKVTLTDVTLTCANEYASVLIVSLDGRPLATARSVLVQAGTTARPTGWKTVPRTFTPNRTQRPVDGEQIESIGAGPWQIEDTRIELTIANTNLREAILVDPSGYASRPVPLDRNGGELRMKVPLDGLYMAIR